MMKSHCTILLLAGMALTSCDQIATEPNGLLTNSPPQIIQLIAEAESVDPGLGVTLTCRAEDPDGDELSYYWSCPPEAGTMMNEIVNDSSTQSTALFLAGSVPRLSAVMVTVTDRSLETLDSLHIVIGLPAPTELKAQVLSETQVRLSWNFPPDWADGFTVERSSSSAGPFAVIYDVSGDSSGCLDGGLTALQSYFYRVAAYNENGSSDYSAVASAYTVLMPSVGLIAWYSLDGNAQDSSGLDHYGQVIGATPIADRFGGEGRALSFDGSGDHIDLPQNLLQIESVTLTAWINWSDNTLANQPIFQAIGASGAYLSLTPKASPHYQFAMSDGVIIEKLQALPPLGTNQWIFVALTLVDGTGTLYKNSVPMFTGTVTLTPAQVTGSSFFLAGEPNAGAYLTGSLDDVRIYDRALEADEIDQLYHEGGWGF